MLVRALLIAAICFAVGILHFARITHAAKSIPSTYRQVTFDTATRCFPEYKSTLQFDPKRLEMFSNGMNLMIQQHANANPEWFIGTAKAQVECRRYDDNAGRVVHRSAATSNVLLHSFHHHNEQNVELHLQETPTNAVAECWEFLLHWMPQQDTALPLQYFVDTVAYALRARGTFPVSSKVPWPIFLNEVLPYSFLSEPRDTWRPQFYEWFVANHGAFFMNASLTRQDAAQFMNTKAWTMHSPPIYFAACGANELCQYSPFSVLRAGNSSCTGLAIFLSACMRSCGLPARVTGVPHWNLGPKQCPHGDASSNCGDHTWAEVVIDGWSFFDPDGNLQLNTSWFFPGWTEHQVPGTTNHSIFATSWASSTYIRSTYGGWYDPLAVPHAYYPMVWNWTGYDSNISSAWDVTRRYLSMDPK